MILSPVLTSMQLPVHVSGLAYLFLKFFGGSKPVPLRNVICSSIYVRHCFGKDGPVLFRALRNDTELTDVIRMHPGQGYASMLGADKTVCPCQRITAGQMANSNLSS